MSEMPYGDPLHVPTPPSNIPTIGDPPPLPDIYPHEPTVPGDPLDVPPPPHEPDQPHPLDPPHIGDPLPRPQSPQGDPPDHQPVITV
ncbi:MAG: hypothetical protein NVS2B7_05590 [Herpetosiphon sp.]